MSESKAEYYAKHLEEQNPNEQMELFQPVGLPTLLARMVNEYRNGVYVAPGEPSQLAEDFNRTLLASAQPLLAEYLHTITTPPLLVVKQQQEDEANLPIMVRTPLATDREMSQQERIEIERGKRR